MDIKDIITTLRRERSLSEARASEQAYMMLAVIKGKHPRVEISAVVVDGENTIICLVNDTQVKFDPTLPVPIWKYSEGKRGTDPRGADTSYLKVLNLLDHLEEVTNDKLSSDEEKRKAQTKIDEILSQRNSKTIDELRDRLNAARATEMGDSVH